MRKAFQFLHKWKGKKRSKHSDAFVIVNGQAWPVKMRVYRIKREEENTKNTMANSLTTHAIGNLRKIRTFLSWSFLRMNSLTHKRIKHNLEDEKIFKQKKN